MKIYNLGSLNIDFVYRVPRFVNPGETLSSDDLQLFPGGKGLNQSIASARGGAEVIHGGMVGADGEFLIDTLKNSGVNTAPIKTIDKKTGHAIIQVNTNGQNCILLYPGANQCISFDYISDFLRDAKEDDILLLQNETSGLSDALEIGHSKKMQIAFNPSPWNSELLDLPLHYVKWWFCNEIEGAQLCGTESPKEIAERFLKKYPHSNLVLTLGKEGSIFRNAETCLFQPSYKVKAVDTTAAGDTFSGYFLSALAGGKNISYALKLASKASSIAVSRPGASASIPYSDEVII